VPNLTVEIWLRTCAMLNKASADYSKVVSAGAAARLARRMRTTTHAIPVAAITKAAAHAPNIMTLVGLVIEGMSASKSLIPIVFGAAPHVTSFTYVYVGQFALMQHIVYFTNAGPPSGGGLAAVECAS